MSDNGQLYEVRQYAPEMKMEWDEFVKVSKNGTFLFNRNYMDYHSDRFCDESLMIYRKGRLFTILPGNIKGDTYWSHQGLTYGGLIMNSKMNAAECIEVFTEINCYLKNKNVKRVIYKPTPYIYHKIASQEDLYALFVTTNTKLTVRCISSTIYEDEKLKFIESRKSGVRKAIKYGIIVDESEDISTFWNILNDNLQANHGTKPVHSSEELIKLKRLFPDNIRLYVAKDNNGIILGGTLIFEMGHTIHTQYISATDEGKNVGALDLLFNYLINEKYVGVKYFDFGHSTENGGKTLNNALIFQKEGFGGRGICYDTYEYDL